MPGGTLLLVHSSVCDTERTLDQLTRHGMTAEVIASQTGPLGPLLTERAEWLRRNGLLPPDAREEEVVVVRARRHGPPTLANPRRTANTTS